jgi:hypothetical protein
VSIAPVVLLAGRRHLAEAPEAEVAAAPLAVAVDPLPA